ncbi:MAG: DUF4097 family beta strand repeat-containing protein [Erysipelotrichaceae bacterium]|nr:DUF4097 family beta strand repeat-containing protein [Erysipelotrichaceae bacterium]
MTKEQYIQELKQELSIYPTSFQNDILEAFEEHFNNGLQAGQSEEEIMTTLGSVDEVMQNIREMEGTPVVLASQKRQKRETKQKEETHRNRDIDIDIDIEGIIRDTLSSVKEALEDVNINFNAYDNDEPEEADTNEEMDLSECHTIRIDSSACRCDIEIVADSNTHYQFFPKKQLFSSAKSHLVANYQDGILTLSMKPANSAGKLSLFVSEEVNTINGNAASGDIDITYVNLERLYYSSTSGDITLCKVNASQTDINCVSGDVEINGLTGNVAIKTTSGDIELENVDLENLYCKTVSGDIEYKGIVEDIEFLTVSGDIEASMEQPLHDMNIRTTSGDVCLCIDDDDYTIEASTLSGEFYNRAHLNTEDLSKRHATFGDGASQVTIQTVSGDIMIRS